MKKKTMGNELFVSCIVADLRREILFIPKAVKENSKILYRAEAQLYFTYKKRYPTFKEVII